MLVEAKRRLTCSKHSFRRACYSEKGSRRLRLYKELQMLKDRLLLIYGPKVRYARVDLFLADHKNPAGSHVKRVRVLTTGAEHNDDHINQVFEQLKGTRRIGAIVSSFDVERARNVAYEYRRE